MGREWKKEEKRLKRQKKGLAEKSAKLVRNVNDIASEVVPHVPEPQPVPEPPPVLEVSYMVLTSLILYIFVVVNRGQKSCLSTTKQTSTRNQPAFWDGVN
jgi:hypothetical protein